jgi:hypothetical protein
VKNANKEKWFQNYLTNTKVYQVLEKVDNDLAEKVHKEGCLHCDGKLHCADYKRKPRGGPEKPGEEEEVYRRSFCCDQDGCRKRHTPPSVRFLGRKVYWGVIVVLVSALSHGLKADRVHTLQEMLGVDRRTLEHWRVWWLETFVQSSFWKAARARFRHRLCQDTLPLPLCQAFQIDRLDRLLALLKFLSPITTNSIPLERTI